MAEELKLAEAFVQVNLKRDALRAGLRGAERDVRGSAARMEQSFAGVASSLGKMFLGITSFFAIKRAFGSVVNAAASYEAKLNLINTLLDSETEPLLEGFKTQLVDLSKQFGESVETLGDGLFQIISASIPADKAMKVLTESVRAAKAGFSDTGVAADFITTVLNAYHISADEAGRVSDVLFQTLKRGKTTFVEFAPAFGMVASTSAAVGQSFEEATAALATMTRAGVQTRIAVTALNAILSTFLKPTKESVEVARRFGLELNATTIKTIGLLGALKKLKNASIEQIAAIFPNVRALRGVTALMGNLEGFQKDVTFNFNSQGEAAKAAAKAMSGTRSELDELKSAFNALKIEMGDALDGPVNAWIEALKDLIQLISDVKIPLGKLQTSFEEFFFQRAGGPVDEFRKLKEASKGKGAELPATPETVRLRQRLLQTGFFERLDKVLGPAEAGERRIGLLEAKLIQQKQLGVGLVSGGASGRARTVPLVGGELPEGLKLPEGAKLRVLRTPEQLLKQGTLPRAIGERFTERFFTQTVTQNLLGVGDKLRKLFDVDLVEAGKRFLENTKDAAELQAELEEETRQIDAKARIEQLRASGREVEARRLQIREEFRQRRRELRELFRGRNLPEPLRLKAEEQLSQALQELNQLEKARLAQVRDQIRQKQPEELGAFKTVANELGVAKVQTGFTRASGVPALTSFARKALLQRELMIQLLRQMVTLAPRVI